MFEHNYDPFLPRAAFYHRMVRYAAVALLMVGISWLIGILGYKIFEGLSWSDSMLNAAMILGGMGPVNALHTTVGKVFASFYALFSGIIFLVSVGIFLAPIFHRLIHYFHLEAPGDADDEKAD